MRHWEAAVARARAGEALSAGRHGRSAVFEALLDGIAIDAALAGSDAGFDGRHLEVGYSAGPLSSVWSSRKPQRRLSRCVEGPTVAHAGGQRRRL